MSADGTMFIYDGGNKVIRMMDTSGNVQTMIDGSCRLDLNMPVPIIPFHLKLRGSVCYKKWVRTTIEVD